MHLMRESWTDERLDDFRAEVNRRFDDVYRRFDEVDRKFDKVDQRFDRVEGEIRDFRIEVKEGFERMYRLMITLGGGFIAAAIASHLF
jgi:DNA anti-recombination protein RmuC